MSDAPGSVITGDLEKPGGEGGQPGDQQQQQQQAQQQEWFTGLPEELRGDASLSRFAEKPVEEVARAFVETKKMVGMDKIVLPKGDDDADGWNAYYDAGGRPKDPAEYKFETLQEGETSKLADAFRPEAHKLGLNQRQVAGLDTFLKGFADAEAGAMATAAGEAREKVAGELKINGEDLAARIDGICTKLDMPAEAASELVKNVGHERTMRWLLGLGEKMGEPGFAGGEGGNKGDFGIGGRDPEELRDEKFADQAWVDRLHAGDPATKKQYADINAAIAAKKIGK